MTKAVVDTNVLISGFIWGGKPREIIDKFRLDSLYILVISPELVHEFRNKLLQKFLVESVQVDQWVIELAQYAELVSPNYLTEICRDPKDNMILDTAFTGKADYIVTGDKDLLILKTFKTTTILTPKAFLIAILARNSL